MRLGRNEQAQAVADGEEAPTHRAAVEIEFRDVSKYYPGQEAPAISSLSLTVPAGQICCLVGPSGGGKTTAMKLVNRLIELSEGDILIGGRSVRAVDTTTLRRDVGYVIQQVGLFPHMTVGANMAVVPRLLRWSRDRIRRRNAELLELVGLAQDMVKRYPAQLSGGQQQRVGLARALAVDPPVMLMDEPFGALDPITRGKVQDEFLALQARIGKTVIFVTHDIDEAIKMGDRIAVLREGGVLAQYATADELLGHPADEYVANFVGADRGLKRLALRQVGDLVGSSSDAVADGANPQVPADTTLRVALSLLFDTGAPALTVLDGGGTTVGILSLEQLRAAVTADEGWKLPAAPGSPAQ
ncbi:MAG TPA: ABC transporter ATP-binding protein [Acidimicrobiales bacterium]|jgi:osmoprotectant transport system ATP-binding protein|nr:ABC transporter ATP-binding protein [Acidimicrobiales bacterium]